MAEPKYCHRCKEWLVDDEVDCPFCGDKLSYLPEEDEVDL